jgi:hypothetical protein
LDHQVGAPSTRLAALTASEDDYESCSALLGGTPAFRHTLDRLSEHWPVLYLTTEQTAEILAAQTE